MRRPYNGSYPITRPFGVYDPAYSNYPGSRHPGTDYGLPVDTPQVSAQAGTVTVIARGNQATGRGNEVIVTNGTTQTKHCHLNRIDVANGSTVKEGQQIGLTGWTGYVLPKSPAGSHLHFEVLQGGIYRDPETQYNNAPSAGGNNMFQNDQEIKEAYAVAGRVPSAAEIAAWRGGSKQRFIQLIKAETDAQRKQLADVKAALANEKAKPPTTVIKEVIKIVEKPVPTGGISPEDSAAIKETNAIVKSIKDLLGRIFK